MFAAFPRPTPAPAAHRHERSQPPRLRRHRTRARATPSSAITEAFNADTNPHKVNLGVGVYCDDDGKVPLLECVKRAEREITDKAAPRGYLPIDGLAAYDKAVQALLFGADSEVVASGRAVTAQALGGTGALKVGADFLRRFAPGAQVWISDPSWENHRALFEAAGFTVHTYPYYDAATRGLDFDAMIGGRWTGSRPARSSCCTPAATTRPASTRPPRSGARSSTSSASRGLVPFLDLAYQGFGDGIERRRRRRSAASPRPPGPLFVASSFSKSFSLYGERVGALTIVAASRTKPDACCRR